MDKLRGVESLPVVLHRFSDGVEVVKCVLEFCNELAVVERSYSESLHRLLRSSSYTFHSNTLMQWLGNEPYEEIGSLKHSWQELGQELHKLADLHSEQAETYQNTVCKPLTELLPQLEEARRALRVKMLQIKANQEMAYKKLIKERQKYWGLGECCERLQTQIKTLHTSGLTARIKLSRFERRLDSTEKHFFEQEQIYQSSHGQFLQSLKECEDEILELYRRHHEKEIERVNTLKESLHQFTKVLSNMAPAYLEGMQRIYFSVDKIDGASDIECFINEHRDLLTAPPPPQLEKHSFVRDVQGEMSEGERQSPIGGTGEREEGATPPLSPISPTSSEEGAPSTVTYDRLPGSKPVKPEKPAGLGETQREKQADTETDETGDEKTATSDRPQKSSRKWPLEGFWGGIKERLKPADPKDEKARKQEEQSDSGGSDIKEIGGAETVVEEESTVKESRAGRRTNTEGGGLRKKKKDIEKVTEEEKNVSDKGVEVEGAGKRDRDNVVQKREESRGTHKQTRRPHSLHVASIVHRMETSEESASSTEVREGPRSPPPSTRTGTSSARRRDKNVGTGQSPKPSKPSPKPKPENLKALLGSGSQEGSSTEVNQTNSQSTNTRLSATAQPRRPLSHKTQPQRSTVQQRHTTQQQTKVPTSQATQKPSSTRQQQQSAVPRVSITTSETRTANGVSNLPILPVVASENQTSPEGNFGRLGAAKPALPPKRTKLDTAQFTNTTLRQMLTRLQQQAAENNYYQLMGVEPGASEEELARVRRERSRQLHPDHFACQPERQERAAQQLMLINQAFQDVLRNAETRSLYDQLCQFRQNYGRIPVQKQRGLETAHSKLQTLHKQLKKKHAPLALLTEIQTALDLITTCQDSGRGHWE